jgi:fructuronate reductase
LRLQRSGAAPPRRIVHLGLGAFARAHLGEYTEDAGDWGICGVAPHRREVVEALAPQGGAYTLIARGEEDRFRVLGAVCEVLHAPSERSSVLAAIADPGVDIVTLTVTEKAYRPGSEIVALLAEGLARRTEPATVLSLDNLPRNGEVLGSLVGGDGAHRFPCTMVDRVVPATTDADRAAVARALGVSDHGAVVAEPFRQWVIEDFDGPRPAWDALFVASSAPHEALKLRLLNGTHSLLAYVGPLLGAHTVAEAWAEEDLVAAAQRLADEDLVPTLPPVPGIDVAGYRAQLSRRWANPRIEHRLAQIALDGDQKLPARFAEPARERIAAGHPPRWIALVLAAYVTHTGTREILAAFPPSLHEHVDDWLERFAADGPRDALRAGLG